MGKDLTGKELGKGFTQRKDGRYQTRISLGGGKKPICLYGHTLKEVKKKREKLLEKTKYGLDIDTHKITLNQWFEKWMELYIVNRIKKTTIRNYIDSYNRCIKYIGYMKLADIQITHVQNMVIELANKGYKKSTIRSTVSVVSSCLERAVIGKMLLFNPCRGIVYPEITNKNFKPVKIAGQNLKRMTNDEIIRFFDVARDTRYYELYILLLFTGMRIGEACALEWKDVDFQNNYLHVYKTINIVPVYYDDNGNKLDRPYYIKQITSPKRTASIRKIPLFKAAVDALYSWHEKQLADKRKYKKSGGLKICY